MQKIEKKKIKNGLEIVFLFDPKFTTSVVQFCFDIGWRNDKENTLGLAHLFEHLVGKRTKNYPGKSEFSRVTEAMGIVSNAMTGPDTTSYYHGQIHANILPSLALLFEAIYNTFFTLEDLEKEKSIVMNESRQYLDNDDSLLWRQTMMNLFPGTTFEKYFFGTEETMKNITLEVFEDFYKIYKNPKNSKLYIATCDAKQKAKIIKFVEDFYARQEKKLLTKVNIDKFEDASSDLKKECIIEKQGREQANIRFGFKVSKFTKRERVIFSVMRGLLTDGFSSYLIEKLRDEMGLVYSISLGRYSFSQNANLIIFATGCDKKDIQKVLESLLRCLDEKAKNLTQKEVDNVVPIKELYLSYPPDPHSDLNGLIDYTVTKDEYLTNEEYIKVLKTIKSNEVKKLMSKVFQESNMTRVILK